MKIKKEDRGTVLDFIVLGFGLVALSILMGIILAFM